jgi:hypothetical protein
MLDVVEEFVNKIISFGGFKRSEFSNKAYAELLTGVQNMSKHDVVMISPLVKKYRYCNGELLIDTTDNPKYGLKETAIKMKNLSNGAYSKGFKIVLFLYKVKDKTIPLGFGLLHKRSKSQEHITLDGLSILRNRFGFKPKMILADGAFGTQKITKRLDDYGIGFVIKGKKTYSLDKKKFKNHIQRGYGSKTGRLNNGVKVKIVKRPNRFFMTNRVSLTNEEVLENYDKRWKIEETFRFLKSCIGLNRCQQHSVKAQELYIFGCLAAYSIFETIRDCSIYKASNLFFSGYRVIDNSMMKVVFAM